jgi:hypothetical protein
MIAEHDHQHPGEVQRRHSQEQIQHPQRIGKTPGLTEDRQPEQQRPDE